MVDSTLESYWQNVKVIDRSIAKHKNYCAAAPQPNGTAHIGISVYHIYIYIWHHIHLCSSCKNNNETQRRNQSHNVQWWALLPRRHKLLPMHWMRSSLSFLARSRRSANSPVLQSQKDRPPPWPTRTSILQVVLWSQATGSETSTVSAT